MIHHHVNAIRNQKIIDPGMKLAPVRVFSCKHSLSRCPLMMILGGSFLFFFFLHFLELADALFLYFGACCKKMSPFKSAILGETVN